MSDRQTTRAPRIVQPVGPSASRMWVTLLVLVLVMADVPTAWAQSQSAEIPGAAEYEDDEFPGFLHDLRRAEIIAIGAFPLVLAFSSLSYDVYRYLDESVDRGELATEYAPWIFAPPEKVPFSDDERRNLLITSAILSATVALADYLIGEFVEAD